MITSKLKLVPVVKPDIAARVNVAKVALTTPVCTVAPSLSHVNVRLAFTPEGSQLLAA